MVGWCSVAFPKLIEPHSSPLPLTLDQTALVAGFLMEGNALGVLFSTNTILDSKAAVLIAFLFNILGWVCLYTADGILELFFSRFCIGFGHSFGTGQLKRYISQTCEEDLGNTLVKLFSPVVNFGVILAFAIDFFVDYREFSLVCVVIQTVFIILFAAIPKKTLPNVEKRLEIVKSIFQSKAKYEVSKFEKNLTSPKVSIEQIGLWEACKDKVVVKVWIWAFLIVFIQQYCGGPAHVVYAQFLQVSFGNGFPKIAALVYSICCLFSEALAMRFSKKLFPKTNLLLCTVFSSVLLSLIAAFFYLNPVLSPSRFWKYYTWIPLILLIFFNIFHTFGISSVPSVLIETVLPKKATLVTKKLYVIHVSLSAVVSTKIFQVIFTHVSLQVAYTYLASVVLCGFVVVLFFFDFQKANVEKKCEVDISVVEVTKL